MARTLSANSPTGSDRGPIPESTIGSTIEAMKTLRLAAVCAVLTVGAGAPPPQADVTPAAIDEVVEQYRAAVEVPGVAVAVTRGDAVLHVAGYGHTPDGTPVTDHTTMATASLSKSFTSLAVMQLVEDGRLGLDDPVREHLPEFGMRDPRVSQITIWQLLNQTSGLTDDTLGQFTRDQPRSLAESVADFRGRTLTSGPGSSWNYYNPNYQIAARIVEVASGQPADTYLESHVFARLGMTDSRAIATDAELPPSARGHVRLLGHAISAPEPPAFGSGSGGVLSSADDMAAWLVMQSGYGALPDGSQLVSPAAIETMRTPSPTSGSYGLGWDIGTTPGGAALVSHSGDLLTSTAHQAVMSDTGYGVAVLAATGAANGDAQTIARRIIATIERDRPEPATDTGVAVDVAFTGTAFVIVGLAAIGVRRSPRWASTRRGWAAVVVRTVPLLAPIVLFAGMAPIVRTLYGGRDVTLLQTVYLYPSFMAALALTAVASTGLLVARTICFARG